MLSSLLRALTTTDPQHMQRSLRSSAMISVASTCTFRKGASYARFAPREKHRHSGIAMHTPASVHDGTWVHVQARRAATLQATCQARPDRFRGRCPQAGELPAKVWINEPPATIETSPSLQTAPAA